MKKLKLLLITSVFMTCSAQANDINKDKPFWKQREEHIEKEHAKLDELISTSNIIVYGELLYPVFNIKKSSQEPAVPAIKIRVIEVSQGKLDNKFLYIPQYEGYVPDFPFPYPPETRVLVFVKNSKNIEGEIMVEPSDGKERVKIFTPRYAYQKQFNESYDAIYKYFKSHYSKERKQNKSKKGEK